MSVISTVDARALFTKQLIEVYKERVAPTSFLRSFFVNKESNTKELSIEVQRGTEKIAADVERGTEGNRNSFSRSSEKIFVPPYYREYFDITDLAFYELLFIMNGEVDAITFSDWLTDVVEKLAMLQDKIERSYELQCAQVLETGVVTLVNGTNINFHRQAGSLVANAAGNTWATGTVDPFATLQAGCEFLRTKGKMAGGVVNAIMGTTALSDFLNNDIVKARADIRNITLDSIRQPQANSLGGVLHGEVTAGSWIVRIWTYPEYYDDASADNNSYINPKKVILIPDAPKFVLGFAGVPQLMGAKVNVGAGLSGQRGAYLLGEYLDERAKAHIVEIASAGVAIPVAVDQIYTVQPVA